MALDPHEIEATTGPLRTVLVLGVSTELPDERTGRRHHRRTDAGALLHAAKYGQEHSPRTAEDAFATLSAGLATVVRATPACAGLTHVVAVPGSEAPLPAFSDRLAQDVALGLGLPLVSVQSRARPRIAAKKNAAGRRADYWVEEDLGDARILIVDDVYRTGKTMSAVALAVVRAGAEHAIGAAAARRLT